MLKVYATSWCPHCKKTVEWLEKHGVPYRYIDMEKDVGPEETKKVIEVNGGLDWVVPTLEYEGKWRPGQFFNAEKLKSDLIAWGVIKE